MDLIKYKDKDYPIFQTSGPASRFAIPFAKEFCKGEGFDIGCGKKEWAFPGAIAVDASFGDGFDAFCLPNLEVDFIFSSHCLEHLPNWVDALDYWTQKLKKSGILFLYLPHYDQEYWRPWNNRKHIHALSSNVILDYLLDRKYKNIFCSGKDLNESFCIVGERE